MPKKLSELKPDALTAFRLPAELLLSLQSIATSRGISLSKLIRIILNDFVIQKQ